MTIRRASSGRPNDPGVSGVTKTFCSCCALAMPRSAKAARNAGSWNTNEKSLTSVIVRPSCPSLCGMSDGGVKVPALRLTIVLKLRLFWR